MDIVEIKNFSLQENRPNSLHCQLFWNKQALNIAVNGNYIEAQYRVKNGYLIFITENSPYEEGLHIYLLDWAKSLLDYVTLSIPYHSAILSEITFNNDSVLTFSFFGNDCWKLKIHNKPRMTIQFNPFSPLKYATIFGKHWLHLSLNKKSNNTK